MHKDASGITAGEQFESFYLLKDIYKKTSSNGSFYFDITLCDRTGSLSCKMWNVAADAEPYKRNTLVKIRGLASEWQGRIQIRIDRLREATAADNIAMEDFVPVAPMPAQEMFDRIYSTATSIRDEGLRVILGYLFDKDRDRLMYFPGAQSMHHSVRSGLLYHMDSMLKGAKALVQIYPILNAELLYAGVILHDWGKLYELDSNELGLVPDYTKQGLLMGHIQQGILLIAEAAKATGAPEETALLLQHMVLSHHYEPEYGSPRRPMFPEAEALHYLDILDARMYDFETAVSEAEPGGFSQRIRSLERRVYRHEFGEGNGLLE